MKINNLVQNNCFRQHKPQMQKALKEMESSFTAEMIRPIFENTVEGTSNKVYQSMLVDEYAKIVGPKTGIANTLACSLLQLK